VWEACAEETVSCEFEGRMGELHLSMRGLRDGVVLAGRQAVGDGGRMVKRVVRVEGLGAIRGYGCFLGAVL